MEKSEDVLRNDLTLTFCACPVSFFLVLAVSHNLENKPLEKLYVGIQICVAFLKIKINGH